MDKEGSIYGLDIGPSHWAPLRSVVRTPERTISGNVVLRVGREIESGKGWHQTEHVVLVPGEAADFGRAVLEAATPSGQATESNARMTPEARATVDALAGLCAGHWTKVYSGGTVAFGSGQRSIMIGPDGRILTSQSVES